jgi:3-hydroxybutyryl-CoA dehydratase
MPPPSVGDVLTAERTFTEDHVRTFVDLSGDRGRHHLARDAQGRLMVHGLLTATLATTIGGQLDYLAREMVFEFLRPVFVGDTIRCTLTITEAVEEPGRQRLAMAVSFSNQDGKEVLRGSSRGVILAPAP